MIIEAMRLALDELKSLQPIMANGLLEQRQLDFIDPHIDRAITALRTAIEHYERDLIPQDKLLVAGQLGAHVTRVTVEQAQEPVAWMYHGIRHDDTPHERPSLIWKPEYMDAMSAEKGVKATPLYTAPRQWQGLTKDELWELWESNTEQPFPEWFVDFKRAYEVIEAKLKEKNT